jgi:glycosyltransferase involved in cell wall biosynthesis
MKVCRIVPLLDFGGVEQRIKLTAIGFQTHLDIELQIVVLGEGGRISAELESIGFNPILLKENIKIPNIKLIFNLYRFLKIYRPDVVHTSGSEANFHGLIAAKLAGVPVRIGEEIGFPNHDKKWKMVFLGVYSFATQVIAISQAVKSKIVSLKEVKADKVEVVYNPVGLLSEKIKRELNSFQIPRKDSTKPFVFITTCRLVPIKNLDLLITVFGEINLSIMDNDLELWIVGDGPERNSLQGKALSLGLSDRVKFLGFQENVSEWLIQADVFVLPSISEGFSISLVEAMQCGLPSIVTNQGGPNEIVIDGETGFLINPKNPEDLKKKMYELISMEKSQRIAIGKRGKESVERFSIGKYVERLKEVYIPSKFH